MGFKSVTTGTHRELKAIFAGKPVDITEEKAARYLRTAENPGGILITDAQDIDTVNKSIASELSKIEGCNPKAVAGKLEIDFSAGDYPGVARKKAKEKADNAAKVAAASKAKKPETKPAGGTPAADKKE